LCDLTAALCHRYPKTTDHLAQEVSRAEAAHAWCADNTRKPARGPESFWHPAIGIQGGYARIKAAGTGRSDAIDLIEFPTPGYVAPLLAGSSLFAVIPAGQRLAFEPTLSFANLAESVGGNATTTRVGLRADLALSSSFYGAAGAVMNSLMQGGNHATQFGAQVAAGYRFALTPRLDGRLEAAVTATQKRRPGLGPTDTYALLFGVSSRLDRGTAPRTARSAAPSGAWETMIGVSGGYSSIHPDGTNLTLDRLFLPGFGGSVCADVRGDVPAPNADVVPDSSCRQARGIRAGHRSAPLPGQWLDRFRRQPRRTARLRRRWRLVRGARRAR